MNLKIKNKKNIVTQIALQFLDACIENQDLHNVTIDPSFELTTEQKELIKNVINRIYNSKVGNYRASRLSSGIQILAELSK
jgi:F0F1-type ATP synthase delta subunit